MYGIKDPVIRERNWRLDRECSAEQLSKDIAYAEDINFHVHEVHFEDRTGTPVVVVWIAGHRAGQLFSAYEIAERRYPVGTRVVYDDSEFGPQLGRVVACLCKRHAYQREIGGRECGCNGPAATCPRPVHVRWDNGDESHEGQYITAAAA